MFGLIDIGGTKLLAAVADSGGSVGLPVRRPTPRTQPVPVLVEMLREASGGVALDGIALAVPGPFDRDGARLVNPPSMSQEWWDLDLGAHLSEEFSCPVVMENDANCAALAEARVGAGAGLRTVMYMTVSTGIGMGMVQDGRLWIGRHDTEGGHIVLWPRWLGGRECNCGGHGCLEALASGLAIRERFGCEAADLDDDQWADVGRWLGLGIVAMAAMNDPDCVVLGGGVCNSWERFEGAMLATVRESLFLVPVPEIRRAVLGEDRNLHGALSLLVG